MLTARLFDNSRVHVNSASITIPQNEVSTFQVEIPFQLIAANITSFYLSSITLYWEDSIFIEGLVEDYELEINSEGDFAVTLRCTGTFGFLMNHKAKSNAYYVDQYVLFILSDLLSVIGNWQVGDITTITTYDIKTTVDLRTKETLWAQIVELCNQIPNLFLRYAGKNSIGGQHRVDVGQFGERAPERLIQGLNLLEFSLNSGTKRVIRDIESYGGNAGSTTISLQHAINYDGSLTTHPNFPILTDANGNKYVRDNSIASTVNSSILKTFGNIQIDNPSPPAADVNAAGYALWQQTVLELTKNQNPREYKAAATFNQDQIQNIPGYISRNLFIHSAAEQEAYDYSTGKWGKISTYEINQFIRCVQEEISFEKGLPTFTFTLSENVYKSEKDNSVQLYDKLQTTRSGSSPTTLSPTGTNYVTVTTGPGVNPDSYYNAPITGPYDGKKFIFDFGVPPGGSTKLYYAIKVENSAAYHFSALPVLPGTDLELIVVDARGFWDTTSAVTIKVFFIFDN